MDGRWGLGALKAIFKLTFFNFFRLNIQGFRISQFGNWMDGLEVIFFCDCEVFGSKGWLGLRWVG